MFNIIIVLFAVAEILIATSERDSSIFDGISRVATRKDFTLISSKVEGESSDIASSNGNSNQILVQPKYLVESDPGIRNDPCLNEDGERPLGCTLLVTRFSTKSFTYVMPSWRAFGLEFWLKAWNPDIYDGFIMSFTSADKTREYRLVIGDEDNEKVKLIYSDGKSRIAVLLKQQELPHLVPSGKWAGYWLRFGKGQIKLGHQIAKNSFFDWSAQNDGIVFDPAFMSFGTVNDAWMGVTFKQSECLVEDTYAYMENKMYSINLWKIEDDSLTTNLKLNLRGTGSAVITLMWTPDFNESLLIEIDAFTRNISLHHHRVFNNWCKLATFNVKSAISANEWFDYDLSFRENNLEIRRAGKLLVDWKSSFSLLFRWFSVSAIGGNIKWSANCPFPDIDGKPRDGSWGDWGPWSCSVTCGRGTGRVERKCDRPAPNIFGSDCKGSSVYEGTCNDFPCGEITPETDTLVRRHLSRNHKALKVKANERVEIPCNSGILPFVLKEVSNLNITWTHNGIGCKRNKFLVSHDFTLVIARAKEKHNGVYLCTAHQNSTSVPSKIHLEVVSLVVKRDNPTKKVRKGNSMTLKCNGLALSHVYADLSQKWELNGTSWKEYGMGVVEMLTTDKLEVVEEEHEGVWTCVITQEDFKFKWVTNWINLKVKTTPNVLSNYMRKMATAPIFDKAGNERSILVIFFSLIVVLSWIIIILICSLVKVSRKHQASP